MTTQHRPMLCVCCNHQFLIWERLQIPSKLCLETDYLSIRVQEISFLAKFVLTNNPSARPPKTDTEIDVNTKKLAHTHTHPVTSIHFSTRLYSLPLLFVSPIRSGNVTRRVVIWGSGCGLPGVPHGGSFPQKAYSVRFVAFRDGHSFHFWLWILCLNDEFFPFLKLKSGNIFTVIRIFNLLRSFWYQPITVIV